MPEDADLLERLPAMGSQPFELPQEYTQLAGTPGVGVVGPQAYRVGVQEWSGEQAAAFAQRQAQARAQAEAQMESQRQAIEQRRMQEWLMQQVQQSGRVDQQLKLIDQSRQSFELGAFQRDLQRMTAAGVPNEEAISRAIIGHPGAFAQGQRVSALKAAMVKPAVPLGQITQQINPITGEPMAFGRTGPQTGRFLPPAQVPVTTSQEISLLRTRATMLAAEIRNDASQFMAPGPEKDAEAAKFQDAKDELSEIQDQLRSLSAAAPQRGAAVAPRAPRPAAAKPHFTWDSKARKLVPVQ